MKIIEILGGIRLPITNEEMDVLNRFHDTEVIVRSDLSEREIHIANQLVNKSVLQRKIQDGKTSYKKLSTR